MHAAIAPARALMRERRYAEAAAMLESALLDAPDDLDLRCDRLIARFHSGDEGFALANLPTVSGASRAGELRRLLSPRLFGGADEPFACQEEPGTSGDRIAAVLIVRDEEEFLPGCLESLRGAVDEIVLVDTGSKDRTVEIALAAGATLGRFDWCDDFAAARNAALELARAEWILWIDADERLEPGGAAVLRGASVRPEFGGYEIEIVNDLGSERFLHHPVRLFRNDPRIRFEGKVHEQVGPSILAAGMPLARLEGVRLLHLGYREEVMAARNKIERTVRMCAAEALTHPKDPFVLFNLANAHHCGGHHAEAVETASAARAVLLGGENFAANLVQIEMASLGELGRWQDAATIADWADARGIASILIGYERARALAAVGDLDAALASVEEAMATAPPPGETGDPAVRRYKARLLRARLLFDRDEGGDDLAADDLRAVIHAAPLAARAEPLRLLVAFGERARDRGDLETAADRFALAAREGDEAGALRWLQGFIVAGSRDGIAVAAEVEAILPHLATACGQTRAAAGDLAGAEAAFARAAEADEADAHARFCLGDARYRLGRFPEAIEAYEAGLRLSPDHADGWFTLGNALAQIGGDELAAKCYGRAIELAGGHAAAESNLAALSLDRAA